MCELSNLLSLCALLGDSGQKEMTPGKKIPIFVDGVVLNGPQTDVKGGDKFVEEACRLIMEEVVLKATDVNEKVKRKHIGNDRKGCPLAFIHTSRHVNTHTHTHTLRNHMSPQTADMLLFLF